MASAGFLALLDDIATLLDDVSVMTKVAAKKTAGVLGDDLALNAQQVTGVKASRELPVVWAVAKGSLLNKLILVPLALLISAVLPWLVTPLLMLGGLYLCYEGVEKLAHKWLHDTASDRESHENRIKQLSTSAQNIVLLEKQKIKGAIRTDFILSAEIIVIALGAAQGASFFQQTLVVSFIALVMTIGVYGLVALIVKFDDLGLWLAKDSTEFTLGSVKRWLGQAILLLAPKFMHFLSVVGMAAMFLVGGGILVHGLPFLHHITEELHQFSDWISIVLPLVFNAFIGVIAGSTILAGVLLANHLKEFTDKHE